MTNARGLRASASIIVSVREPEITNLPPEVVNDRLTVEIGETVLDRRRRERPRSRRQRRRPGTRVVHGADAGNGDPKRQHHHVRRRDPDRQHDDQLPGRRRRRRGLARAAPGHHHRTSQPTADRGRPTPSRSSGPAARSSSACSPTTATPTRRRAACRSCRRRWVSGDATVSLTGSIVTVSPAPELRGPGASPPTRSATAAG